jgi:NDP-sugar pyrophosphorylase family protein
MNPITEGIPKALFSIAGNTLIERIISQLRSAEIERIVIGVGWLGGKIRDHVSEFKNADNIEVVDVSDYEKGPLYTLKGLSSHIDKNKPFLIIPSDFITNEEIIDCVISAHLYGATPRIMTVGVDKTSNSGATVHSDEEGLISGLGLMNKSSVIGRCTMVVATDYNFMKYCDLAIQAGNNKVSDAINRMIAYNEPVRPAFVEGKWYDIDRFEDLLSANRMLLHDQVPHGADMIYVPSGDRIEVGDRMNLAGDIVIESGVSLIGPLLIQRESRISSSAIVGPFVSMAPKSSIGEECSISNSILFESVEVPANRTLEDVIVHPNGIARS